MKYYLYRHIRLDKNEPFYIGIGTVYNSDISSYKLNSYYKRAYTKNKRSKIWNGIINKTEYIIEILFETDNYNIILEKEKEFINLYGRKNLGTGCLVNLTDGGEGSTNYIVSDETKEKIRNKAIGRKWSNDYKELFKKIQTGRKHSIEHVKNAAAGKHKPILQISTSGEVIKEWECSKLAAEELKLNTSNLCSALKGIQKKCGGYLWKYKYI